MSNPLAIATVTEVLAALADLGAQTAVDDFNIVVSTGRPDLIDADDGNAHVNLFLYQALPNPSLRHRDSPNRRGDGSLVRRPVEALDLRYLLTFIGSPGQRVPERLLGGVVAGLQSEPVLTRDRIVSVINDNVGTRPYLANSDLADQIERVKVTSLGLGLEELSKLWSVFFQTPYSISYAVEASVVLIESPGGTPQAALPVRGPAPPDGDDGRRIYVEPFRRPAIEEIVSAAGPGQPIVAGSTVEIRGRDLTGEITQVLFSGTPLGALAADPTDERIVVPLTSPPVPAAALRAGLIGVQVKHERLMGDPAAPHAGNESNVAPLVLRPTLTGVAAQNVVVTGDSRSADLVLDFDPAVGKTQRVVVLLNELDVASPPAPAQNRPARVYTFEAPSRDVAGEPDSRVTVTVPIEGVRPDTYLVRVQVDGAESSLTLGTLPQTPGITQYVDPSVVIP